MYNPTAIAAERLSEYLSDLFLQYFSSSRSGYAAYLRSTSRMVIESMGTCSALYHNVDHTVLVTLVGQQILRGQLLTKAISPEDWLHYTCALLIHDIGFVRGACGGDTDHEVVINDDGERMTPPRGASDAILGPHHVDRGKIYARERFASTSFIDEERLASAVEMTRFPVPAGGSHDATDTEAGLVRAADLIGQLGDPFYHRKMNALFHEFVETGQAEAMNLKNPRDLMELYPGFYWNMVEPYINPAIRYLEKTADGRAWIANLHSNVFQIEHHACRIGPFPGPCPEPSS